MVETVKQKHTYSVEPEIYAYSPSCTYSHTLVTLEVHTPEPSEAYKNQYVFCGNNPVMFVDPFGLVFKWGEGGWSLVGTVAGIAGGSIVLAATSPAWVTAGAIIGIGGGIIGVIDAWTGADKATKIPQRAVDKWTKPSRSGAPTAGGLYKDSDGDGMPDAIDDTPYPPKKKRGE